MGGGGTRLWDLSKFRYTDIDTIDRKTTLHYLHIQTRSMLGPTFYFPWVFRDRLFIRNCNLEWGTGGIPPACALSLHPETCEYKGQWVDLHLLAEFFFTHFVVFYNFLLAGNKQLSSLLYCFLTDLYLKKNSNVKVELIYGRLSPWRTTIRCWFLCVLLNNY